MSGSTSSRRPHLPTSSSAFALPVSSSSQPSGSVAAEVAISPLMMLPSRRPSLLGAKLQCFSDSRLQSPLAASFTLPFTRDSSFSRFAEEGESDRERMCTDSPTPSSGGSQDVTPPPLGPPLDVEARVQHRKRRKHARSRSPSTPPRGSSNPMDIMEPLPRAHMRRLSYPLKPPRILTLLQESRPEENELKSEAQFQRLIASVSDLPLQNRAIRPPSERGRYPEEATTDDISREETPSDDGEAEDTTTFAFGFSDPIAIPKPSTPSQSVNGDDLNMTIPESPGNGMDIDMTGSPMLMSASATSSYWRYTPPPTTSAVRSNKRKFTDDRFDPYPTAKRRAVSPSFQYLRDGHGHRTPGSSRGPVAISIPGSGVGSATSSPTVSQGIAYPSASRTNIASSPTMRSAMILASPILRPMVRSARREEEDEREIVGAGDAVGGLTLA